MLLVNKIAKHRHIIQRFCQSKSNNKKPNVIINAFSAGILAGGYKFLSFSFILHFHFFSFRILGIGSLVGMGYK